MERFLVFVYHCFDRIVIQGYLPLLTDSSILCISSAMCTSSITNTRQVLAQRTKEYRGWVSGYARNHEIPILKAQKRVSKGDSVRPDLQRMERRNQHGVHRPEARMALLVLPGQVLKPLLAASMGTRPTQGVQNPTTLDNYYETIRVGMQGLFRELGLAA